MVVSQKPKIIISDIDGTLLDDAGKLPIENREALRRCRAEGIPVCLATGRRWTTLKRLLERLDLSEEIPLVVHNNGMAVKNLHEGTLWFRCDLDFELMMSAVIRLNRLGLDPIVLGHSETGSETDVFWRRDCLMNGDFVEKNPLHERRIDSFEDLKSHPLVEILLLGPEARLREAEIALQELPLETALIKNSFYAGYMLEVTPRGVSKATGAGLILDRLGFTADEMMAIGDSANDLPLLRMAGHSFAVANAPEPVRSASRSVVGSNDSGGVAQAITFALGW